MRMTRGVRLLGVALLVLLLGGVDELGIGSGRFGCGGVMAQMNPNEEGDEAKQDPLQPGAEVVTGDPDNFGHGGPGDAMGEVNEEQEGNVDEQGLAGESRPTATTDELRTMNNRLKSKIIDLEAYISTSRLDQQVYVERIAHLERENKLLRTGDASARAFHDLANEKEKVEFQVKHLESTIDVLKKENAELRQQNTAAKFTNAKSIFTLENEVKFLETEKAELSDKFEKEQNRMSLLVKENKELQNRVTELRTNEGAIEAQCKTIRSLEGQFKELNAEYTALKDVHESLTTENASLKDATDKLHQVQSDNIAIQKQIDQLLQEKQAWEAVKNGSSEGQTNNISLASLKTCKDQLIAKQLEVDQLLQDKQALEAVKNGSSEGQTNNISLASFNACKDQLIAKQLEVDQLLQGMQARDAADALVRQKVQRRKRNDLIIGVLLGLVLPLLVLLVLLLYLCWQRSRQTVPNVGTMPSSFEMDFDFQQ